MCHFQSPNFIEQAGAVACPHLNDNNVQQLASTMFCQEELSLTDPIRIANSCRLFSWLQSIHDRNIAQSISHSVRRNHMFPL